MTCTSTGAPTTHAFNPAQWLSDFEAAGGGYTITDSALHLVIARTGAGHPGAMLDDLTADQRADLQRYLENNQAPSAGLSAPSTKAIGETEGADDMSMMGKIEAVAEVGLCLDATSPWDAAVARFEKARAAEDYYWHNVVKPADEPLPHEVSKRSSELAEEHGEAERAMMNMPAPNLSALRTKLDNVFRPDTDPGDDFMAAWLLKFVGQTMADYRRLLSVAPAKQPRSDSSIDELYSAYRRAKATWDLALYAPECVGEDLADEINEPLSDAHDDALKAFLFAPANDSGDLLRKMRVFQEERVWEWGSVVGDVISRLCNDVRDISLR